MKHAYRPHVDGLRAIAVLFVIVFHALPSWAPGGFTGVDVFFVISGFLISSIILEGLREKSFRFTDFYARRIRRIFPALAVVLIACWFAGRKVLTLTEFEELTWHIVAGAGFTSNLLLWSEAGYFDTAASLKPLLHLWSLGIEEQYYLVWPVILLFAFRFRINVLAVVAVLALASFAANIWLVSDDPVGAYFLPHARFWELLIGAALAQAAYQWPNAFGHRQPTGMLRFNLVAETLTILSLAGFIASTFVLSEKDPFPGWWALAPVLSTAALVVVGERSRIGSLLLANPVMVGIGLISYPLYLWHWPLLSFARILEGGEPTLAVKAGLVAAAFVLAVLTYWLIERPIRFGKLDRRAATLAAAVAVVAIGGWAGFNGWTASANAASGRTPTLAESEYPAPEDVALAIAAANKPQSQHIISNCSTVSVPEDTLAGEFCRIWNDPALPNTFVLWGDSHAHAWVPVVAKVASMNNARLVEFAHAGCPPIVDVHRTVSGGVGAKCNSAELAQEVMQHIERISPSRIIVAARWSLYTRGLVINGQVVENTYLTLEEGGATPQSSDRALAARLGPTLARLARLAPTVVIQTLPRLHQPVEAGVARSRDTFEPTPAEHATWESGVTPYLKKAVAETPRLKLFDPSAIMCKQKCRAFIGGVAMYSDDNHITEAGSLLFAESLGETIASAGD